MVTLQRSRQEFVLAALAFMLCSCGGPRINEFIVQPLRPCENETVRISYDVSGTPNLYVTTRARGNDGTDTTEYLLVVIDKEKTTRMQKDVVRFPRSFEKTLLFEQTRPLGNDTVEAVQNLSEETWGSDLRLESVASQSGRPLRLWHDGREDLLDADGGPSFAFEGTVLFGEWRVKAPLLPGEVMGDPAHAPPDLLTVRIRTQCMQRERTP